jgi:hypothetical protein
MRPPRQASPHQRNQSAGTRETSSRSLSSCDARERPRHRCLLLATSVRHHRTPELRRRCPNATQCTNPFPSLRVVRKFLNPEQVLVRPNVAPRQRSKSSAAQSGAAPSGVATYGAAPLRRRPLWHGSPLVAAPPPSPLHQLRSSGLSRLRRHTPIPSASVLSPPWTTHRTGLAIRRAGWLRLPGCAAYPHSSRSSTPSAPQRCSQESGRHEPINTLNLFSVYSFRG